MLARALRTRGVFKGTALHGVEQGGLAAVHRDIEVVRIRLPPENRKSHGCQHSLDDEVSTEHSRAPAESCRSFGLYKTKDVNLPWAHPGSHHDDTG